MTHILFIRFFPPPPAFPPDPPAIEWLVSQEKSGIAGSSAGVTTLAQGMKDILALQIEIARVVILIPGEHVLVTTVPVHRKHKHQIAEALNYVVEEQLAAPADSVHATLGAAV